MSTAAGIGIGNGSTIRTRIALVYGGAFLVLGAVLLAVVNLLAGAGTRGEAETVRLRSAAGGGSWEFRMVESPDPGGAELVDQVSRIASRQMLVWSLFALLVMAVCAVLVGWWTAGRVLRPVHVMTERARRLSERNLRERIAVQGPDDELKELGDTIDGLLSRLEKAFDSQRRFIANASHELRTPLATQRTAIQVGLDEEEPLRGEQLAALKRVLLDGNRRSERLIDGLLVLARGERGLDEREDVELGELVREECARYGVEAGGADGAATVRGNRALLAQLARNLLVNAVTYNVPDGTVVVRVEGAVLTVANTGPRVSAAEIPALWEPFRRGRDRDRTGEGAGLGLSIVRSVAEAHGGTARAVPGGAGGGLVVTVDLTPACVPQAFQDARISR
ncbi:HAMP domain-containing protein [Streptomyces sp. MUM 203J]|uniref:sensor histidine kinase n=1 Tax=Streptomyces sp. MUM 203J TaxID=2791990 RepID=UPI001F049467|nr:ATP-binding protein [Streptomyces sp. MUM 203J]MCH0540364.1 HAMP domain-containing protein [Streptomyces sp. MUM 203J]